MVATQRMMATRVGAPCLDRVGLFTEWLRAVHGGNSAHDGHPCRRPVPRPGWFVYTLQSGSEQCMVATQRMTATRVGAQCLDRVGLFTERVVQSSAWWQLSA
jgi:hypothetical protein